MVRRILAGVFIVLLFSSLAYADIKVGSWAGEENGTITATSGTNSSHGFCPAAHAWKKHKKDGTAHFGSGTWGGKDIGSFIEKISTAVSDFKDSISEGSADSGLLKEAIQTFVQALKDIFSDFHADNDDATPGTDGTFSNPFGSKVCDVTVSESATGDGNVRSARVIERGDTVYGVVRYGRSASDTAATQNGSPWSSWSGGDWHRHGHERGHGHHGSGKSTKVEFTGIAADDIKSVTLDSVDGKLQFQVTKTDGTVATFDVPEKNGHTDTDDDDTPDVIDDTAPTDFSSYTDSAALVTAAWNNLNDKKYNTAKAFANETIAKYSAEAGTQQAGLSGFASEDDASDYAALNDVATAHFILGKIYAAQGDEDAAAEQFNKIIGDYSYAQCWDTHGWWWKVAQGAKDELDKLD